MVRSLNIAKTAAYEGTVITRASIVVSISVISHANRTIGRVNHSVEILSATSSDVKVDPAAPTASSSGPHAIELKVHGILVLIVDRAQIPPATLRMEGGCVGLSLVKSLRPVGSEINLEGHPLLNGNQCS